MPEYITISDCAIVLEGKNIDKKKLNTEGKGLPYIVGASCLQNSRVVCKSFCENTEKQVISHLGDVIISTVGTLGKFAVNDIGDCVLSKHVCAVRFVPQILPEYGLLCLKGSLAAMIPPQNDAKTGFSRKLDAEAILKCPLLLIGINAQRATVEKMIALSQQFPPASPKEFEENNLPDDPIKLAEWFKRKSRRLLNQQHNALDNIVRLLKEPFCCNNKGNENQLTFFKEDF